MNVKTQELSPLGTYKEGMPWNPVEKIIMERRSIRTFRKDPLPDTMIERILEAGRFAPSAGNSQPWRFIVVKSQEMIAEMERDAVKVAKFFMFFLDYTRGNFLRRIITKFYAKIFIRIMPNELHPSPFGALSLISQGKTMVFHHAPTLILLVEDRRGASSPLVDIGVCGQNMVLTAHSLGAGSCWIGMIKLLKYVPKWKKKFGIRFPYNLGECIAVGWQSPRTDGLVPRETQIIEWFDKGLNDPPRTTIQGE